MHSPLLPLHNPGAPIALRFGGLELVAFSISGVATYVMVPAFDACFDLGHCPVEAARMRNVFLSHVHQDHATGALRHASLRQMFDAGPPRVYVPRESADALADVFRAFERLEQKPEVDLSGVIRGVAPGDQIPLGRRYTVHAFDVTHRIASRGYTVVEARRKLRPEYQGRPGAEIHAARERGETVEDVVHVPAFTYVGDSTIETLRRNPQLGRSEVLLLEATHLPGTSRAPSVKYGHTHLEELIELYHAAPETLASRHVVLKHFSTRYHRDEIKRAHAALPEELRARTTMLI